MKWRTAFLYYFICNLVSVAFLLFIRFHYGIFYGWCDDVIFDHAFRGTFMAGVPLEEPIFYFIFFGRALAHLYKSYPHIAWYGWFLVILNTLSLSNILFVFVLSTTRRHYNIINALIFGILFTAAFCIREFILLDYTRAAIFLAGTSLLALVVMWRGVLLSAMKCFLAFMFFAMFFCAALIRFEVIPLCMIESLILFVFLFRGRDNYIKIVGFSSLLTISLVSWLIIIKIQDTPEKEKAIRVDTLMNICDGVDHYHTAVISGTWHEILYRRFWADSKLIGYADSVHIGIEYPAHLLNIKNIKEQIAMEVTKARYLYYLYNPAFNYSTCLLAVSAIALLLLLFNLGIRYIGAIGLLPFVTNLMIFITFSITMLAAAIFERMDDRFLIPHAICCLLFMLMVSLFELKNDTAKKFILTILGLVFCVIAANNTSRISQITAYKQTEMRQACELRRYISEHYRHKLLIFDLSAEGLFLDDPMANTGPDTSNILVAYGDLGSSIFSSYRNKIKSLIGRPDDADCFLQYAAENEARFLITDDRKKLYEKYVMQVYDKKYALSATDSTCPIYQYHFCAMPYRYTYGVYRCAVAKGAEQTRHTPDSLKVL